MTNPACALLETRAGRLRARTLPDPLTRSLRCLGHPLTLTSISLLLLNDHLLKRLYPSPLTGKLSDFAGLFFFPYLLAALLGLAKAGFRCMATASPWRTGGGTSVPALKCAAGESGSHPTASNRWTPQPAFLLTALIFGLLKLDPWVNAGASAVLRSAFGLPVQIVRDPTDLVALLALVPSYLLWSSRASARGRLPRRRTLTALGMASLAALATSPCIEPQPITHLIPHEAGLYAQALYDTFLSTDEGQSWDYLDRAAVPAAVLEAASLPVRYPKTVCAPGLEYVCYRAAGREQVEVSTDAGRTWQIAWSLPASRRDYMQRVASGHGQLLACGKSLDLRALDLAMLGEGPDHVVIAAVGNEGVLRGRHDQAEWSRVGVGAAEPTPVRGELQQLFPPMIILGETGLALAGGLAAFLLLSVLSWGRLVADEDPSADRGRPHVPWVVAAAIDLLLLGLLALAGMLELIPAVLPWLIGLTAMFAAMSVRWGRALRRARRPADARRSFWISACAGLLAGTLLWVPPALWVLGLIPGYSAAFWLAICGAAACVGWCLGRLPKVSRPAPPPDQPVS